ncbi:MAG: hypothetical protein A2138_21370 [Deltaproteobacteria bacterium RBG_16_71_12]|nr:MAG: hypothetical protein A2138_21370 [Deltaproteobacteria bacterium RBG_16_71_12]
MRFVKKLMLLAVAAIAAAGALLAWQSPYYSLWQIDRGLDDKDLGRVERYVDLEALVKASVQVTGALATEQAGVGGTDLGSALLGALVGVVAAQVGDAAAPAGAAELRRAVVEGRVTRALGPFTVNPGWRALGGVATQGERAVVDLEGTCHGTSARLGMVFERRDAALFGPSVGWPKKWVLVGVDADSVKALAKTCRAS